MIYIRFEKQNIMLLISVLFSILLQCYGIMPVCNDNVPVFTPSESELPLCGNGKLDINEVCDDGNRVGNDGCNAWCSAFDGMSSTCTLAGKNNPCLYSKTVLGEGGHPAKSTFCSLRSIDIHASGKYVLFADYNTLLKMNLFTDQVATSLSMLSVNTLKPFSPICSINIFADDSSFLTYECTSQEQEINLISSTGFSRVLIAKLDRLLVKTPETLTPPPKLFIIPNSRDVLIAGVSTNTTNNIVTGFETCVDIFHLMVPTFESFFNSSSNNFEVYDYTNLQSFARIPCIIYNAMEQSNMNTKYKTFFTQGMIPKYILYEDCIHSHILDSKCFVVYMERNDLQFLKAYIPEDGGYDIAYVVSTRKIMDNAMGLPMIRYGKRVKYSSQGACFTAQNQAMSSQTGMRPPSIALGNICKHTQIDCSTPFNNPFITDIVMSPYLIPEGLNSFNTHWQLSQVFSSIHCDELNHNSTLSQESISGALFYKKILNDVYANTTPIDFVEIPSTQDVIYITATSIGLIGTKQTILLDPKNKGYCKVHDMIYCPDDFFGSVEHGVCRLCNDTSSPGFGTSIAWQVKCAIKIIPNSNIANAVPDKIKNNLHVAPSERYSTLTSKNVDEFHMYDAVCTYLKSLGEACPERRLSILGPKQQFNIAADRQDSILSVDVQNTNLIQCLIRQAEQRLSMPISNQQDAEYISTWTTEGFGLLKTLTADFSSILSRGVSQNALNNITLQNKTYSYNESKLLETCMYNNYIKIVKWLQCAIPFIISSTENAATGNRRRLLQSDPASLPVPKINENQGITMVSTTPVTYQPDLPPIPVVDPPAPPSKSEGESFPFAIGIGIGVAAVVVLGIIAYILYRRKYKV